MNKHVFELLTSVIGISLMAMAPLGVILTLYTENSAYLLMPIIAGLILSIP